MSDELRSSPLITHHSSLITHHSSFITHHSSLSASLPRGLQTRTNQLLVVAGEDVLVGEGGVGPADAVAQRQLAGRRADQLRAADLLESLRRQPRDEEL